MTRLNLWERSIQLALQPWGALNPVYMDICEYVNPYRYNLDSFGYIGTDLSDLLGQTFHQKFMQLIKNLSAIRLMDEV